MKKLGQGVLARVKHWVKALWAHRLVRRIFGTLAIILCLVVGFQLMYPRSQALPNARIDGISVGYKAHDELMPLLESSFTSTKVTFSAEALTATVPLTEAGATFDSDAAAMQLSNYPWWQRLLPFSLFLKQTQVTHLPLTFNDEKLVETTGKLAAQLHSEPKNGQVTVGDDGVVAVSAAQDGVAVSADALKEAFKTTALHFGDNTLKVKPTLTAPAVTNDMVESVKVRLESVLKIQLSLRNSLEQGSIYTPDAKTVASWITIGDKLALSINKEAVQRYANTVAKNSLIAAGTTTVVVVDGIEQSRTAGAAGRAVNIDALSEGVSKALLEDGEKTVIIQFESIAPAIVYQRSYSSSQAALQAYLNDVSSGKNIEISVKQLSGAGWSASVNASKSVVAASTYKLFVSLLLLDKINAGQLQWTDAIQGTDVSTCLRNTIVLSANNCAEEWIAKWGRSAMNSALYAKGFSSSTTFTASDATHTSAADLQKLLIGLHTKTLFNESNSSRLISLMKQQVYRKGIPAGSNGTVADKVGFLWDYLNDAAIVYHPRGTYVLVVMTQGQSWGKIAEITAQIEKIMYP